MAEQRYQGVVGDLPLDFVILFPQLFLNFEGDIPQRDLNHEEKYCWSEKDIFSAISEM